MAKNKSALDPVKKLVTSTYTDEKNSFFTQIEDFLLRYYIGISDFRGKGVLVDCGLPHRIEKYLSLNGKLLLVEWSEKRILPARLMGEVKRDLDGNIVKLYFALIDDNSQETYQVRISEQDNSLNKDIKGKEKGKKTKKLVVYDKSGKKDVLLRADRMVLFLNNEAGIADQNGVDLWKELLWETLEDIRYDRKKCRKKMALFTRTKMDAGDKADAINEFEENDYIFNIHFTNSTKGKGKKTGIDPSETNYSLSGPEDSKERTQLWQDYREYIIEMCKFHGLVFQSSFKQERQNIPETMMAEAPYKAWERERKQYREEAYRQCEKLGWIEKGWELNYGAQAETNEQKIKKLEEELKLAELEEKLTLIQKQRAENEANQKTEKNEFKNTIIELKEPKK